MERHTIPANTASRLEIRVIGSSQSCHVRNRVKCFAQRGYEVKLITNHPVGIDGVEEISPRPRSVPRLRMISLLLELLRMIRRGKPDIVHVHFAHGLESWMAAVADHHPLVVSVWGGDILFEEQGHPTPRSRWLTLQLLQSADLITAESDFIISVLDRLDGLGSKTIKVVWGVDPSQFRRVDASDLRQDLGISSEDRIILSPKLLDPFYNVHLIVEAMPKILSAYPNTVLLITEYLGQPDYKAELAAQIRRLGLEDRTLFIGEIAHEDMPKYYSLADVVVAIPPSDGVPQTRFEAMSCEVPNVLSRLPRYEEFGSHEEAAYFVDISSTGVADGVTRLFDDGELRRKIITNGLRIVREQADFRKEVDRVEAKFYELLEAPTKRLGLVKRARILITIFLYLVTDVRHGNSSSRLSRIIRRLAPRHA